MRSFFTCLVAIALLSCNVCEAQAPVKAAPKDVTVTDFKIRVIDEVLASDWTHGFQSIDQPAKVSTLQGSEDQRLQLSFSIVDATKSAQKPHQVFVRLASSQKEVILIPDVDSAKSTYKLDVDFKVKSKQFDNLSGIYELSLIIGDTKFKPMKWGFGNIVLTFSQSGDPEEDYFARKPDIVHMFREPEKRPPVFVSNVFGLVVLGLFVVMLLLWSRIGISLSNISASSLLFQASLGTILYIEYMFYLGNDMFTTLRYLTWAAPFSLYLGKRMLSNLAKSEEN